MQSLKSNANCLYSYIQPTFFKNETDVVSYYRVGRSRKTEQEIVIWQNEAKAHEILSLKILSRAKNSQINDMAF